MKIELHQITLGCLTVAAIGLIVGGFFVPPTGVIDGSVLTAVGELLGFRIVAELPVLLKSKKEVRVQHGSTSVEINNDNDEDTEE